MRKLFFNPGTCFVICIALFFALKGLFGQPHSWYGTLGFLSIFIYGCGLTYLLNFFGSGWYAEMKPLRFPDACGHPIFRLSMARAWMPYYVLSVSALLLAFGTGVEKLLALSAAWATVSTVAASITLWRKAPTPVS